MPSRIAALVTAPHRRPLDPRDAALDARGLALPVDGTDPGGRWAYDVLGWGGYWGWDPVEIAAFMPWLTGTAFLHSVMIQEKRGMLKHWNMLLIILTYCLVIFGTFLTRSGVLSSVHAFAQSAIGPLFFRLHRPDVRRPRWRCLLSRWNDLRGENQLTSLLSRESLFLLNNLLFVSILVVVLLGRHLPADLGAVHGSESAPSARRSTSAPPGRCSPASCC